MTKISSANRRILCAAALASTLVASNGFSQSSQAAPHPPSPVAAQPKSSARYVANFIPPKAQLYYLGVWGIDSLKVKYTESGEMIRFTYRVVDPAKAVQLNDSKVEPALYDPQVGVKLVVPQMEKIGKLRQSSTPIMGKSYWMAFSNSGRRVRPGDRVSIEVGSFHAINLEVE